MFYRLTHVDAVPLPTVVRIDGRPSLVTEGGLLTEPPDPGSGAEGYAMFRLDGPVEPAGRPSLVLASAEPYRWLEPGCLEMARAGGAPSLRLRGWASGAMLSLSAEPAPEPLDGSRFTFTEAGDEPIPPSWQDAFNFGPPVRVRRWVSGPPDDPDMLRTIAALEAEQEAARLAEAERRLLRAWRSGT